MGTQQSTISIPLNNIQFQKFKHNPPHRNSPRAVAINLRNSFIDKPVTIGNIYANCQFIAFMSNDGNEYIGIRSKIIIISCWIEKLVKQSN